MKVKYHILNSSVAGVNFWEGAAIGFAVTGFNHLGHGGEEYLQNKPKATLEFIAEGITYIEGHQEVIAFGKLRIISNGKLIEEFDALSGPLGNGVLPNGSYRVGARASSAFSQETNPKGSSFQYALTPKVPFGLGPNGEKPRYNLVIHSVYTKEWYINNGYTGQGYTQGCIGIYKDAARFFSLANQYSINSLTVNILNNPNLDWNKHKVK